MDARGNSRRLARGWEQKVGTWLADDFDRWEDPKGASGDDKRVYNTPMRCPLAQAVVFAVASLFACTPSVPAQATADPEVRTELQCPPPIVPRDELPKGPEISFAEVTFSGSLQLPISDQEQIAASVKEESRGPSLDGLVDDAIERVRAGWQNHGYFKVQVSGEMRTLTGSPDAQHMVLDVQVDEGLQYRLNKIRFKHNKVFRDVEALRSLFPIEDGEVLSREKIAIGLESLRKAYDELGYINFTAIPDTQFDDERGFASLDIDIDEGKKFRMGAVNILGLDEPAREEVLRNFPVRPGQVFDSKLFESFLLKHASMSEVCSYNRLQDDKAGTVTITCDFRPCPGQ